MHVGGESEEKTMWEFAIGVVVGCIIGIIATVMISENGRWKG